MFPRSGNSWVTPSLFREWTCDIPCAGRRKFTPGDLHAAPLGLRGSIHSDETGFGVNADATMTWGLAV